MSQVNVTLDELIKKSNKTKRSRFSTQKPKKGIIGTPKGKRRLGGPVTPRRGSNDLNKQTKKTTIKGRTPKQFTKQRRIGPKQATTNTPNRNARNSRVQQQRNDRRQTRIQGIRQKRQQLNNGPGQTPRRNQNQGTIQSQRGFRGRGRGGRGGRGARMGQGRGGRSSLPFISQPMTFPSMKISVLNKDAKKNRDKMVKQNLSVQEKRIISREKKDKQSSLEARTLNSRFSS